MPQPLLCNPKPFKDQFRRDTKERKERRYCFILGAGASISSGIPSGKALAGQWLRELYERQRPTSLTITEWCARGDCPVQGVDPKNPGAYYPQLFRARFPGNDPEGQRFIQEAIRGNNPAQPNLPSIGYAYLSLLLQQTESRIVISTNFDNLAADALLLFTGSLPRIVGHERIASFAGLRDGQPLIAKIHGDVGFAPTNDPAGVSILPNKWHKPLRKIFRDHIPVVIGNDGNDGSLMDFLVTQLFKSGTARHSLLRSGLYWCYRADEGRDWKERIAENPRLKKVTEAHQVHFVPIGNFDLWMMELGEACKVGDPETKLREVMERRVKSLTEQLSKARTAQADTATDPAVEASRAETREEIGKRRSEWEWIYKARAEKDTVKAEEYYRKAVGIAPKNHAILSSYANFLADERKDYDRAEVIYQKALAAAPNDAINLGNYASFLELQQKDYGRAEEFYKKALAVDPNDAINLGKYAKFLDNHRKDYDRAEEFYQKALAADPNHAQTLGNYAEFLLLHRTETQARKLLRRAALASSLREPEETNRVAAILWMTCALRAIAGQLYTPIIGAIKTLVTAADYTTRWSYDDLIVWAEQHFPKPEDSAFWTALAHVCAGKEKPETLNGFAQWREVTPTPIETALHLIAENT